MRGITKAIKTTFAPHWKFKQLQHVPRNVGGLRKRAACRRGKLLDRELSQFALTGPDASFCAETQLVIAKLNELRLTLTHTQVYVSDADWKLCTHIDLLAVDQTTGQHVVIETKRGCHYRRCSTKSGSLKFHDAHVTDCLENQHQLQALLGKMLFERTHATHSTCCLIYVNEEKCECISEPDFKVQVSPTALQAIKTFKPRTRK